MAIALRKEGWQFRWVRPAHYRSVLVNLWLSKMAWEPARLAPLTRDGATRIPDGVGKPAALKSKVAERVGDESKLNATLLGLRGWRIRREADGFEYGVARPKSDGVWGSFPAVATYVVLGSQLARPWQVGVATGGCGVLLRPNFFDDSVFRPPPEAPSGILVVDDVWMNGMLARRNVTRWIVPTGGALHCDEGRHHLGHGAAPAGDANARGDPITGGVVAPPATTSSTSPTASSGTATTPQAS